MCGFTRKSPNVMGAIERLSKHDGLGCFHVFPALGKVPELLPMSSSCITTWLQCCVLWQPAYHACQRTNTRGYLCSCGSVAAGISCAALWFWHCPVMVETAVVLSSKTFAVAGFTRTCMVSSFCALGNVPEYHLYIISTAHA